MNSDLSKLKLGPRPRTHRNQVVPQLQHKKLESRNKAVVEVIANAEERILMTEEMTVVQAAAAQTVVLMTAAMAQMEMTKVETEEGHWVA